MVQSFEVVGTAPTLAHSVSFAISTSDPLYDSAAQEIKPIKVKYYLARQSFNMTNDTFILPLQQVAVFANVVLSQKEIFVDPSSLVSEFSVSLGTSANSDVEVFVLTSPGLVASLSPIRFQPMQFQQPPVTVRLSASQEWFNSPVPPVPVPPVQGVSLTWRDEPAGWVKLEVKSKDSRFSRSWWRRA